MGVRGEGGRTSHSILCAERSFVNRTPKTPALMMMQLECVIVAEWLLRTKKTVSPVVAALQSLSSSFYSSLVNNSAPY